MKEVREIEKEVIDVKNKIKVIPRNFDGISEEERVLSVKILNMFNEADLLVCEAVDVLEICKEALMYTPVIRYVEPEL
ncbi:MAG: hypothetical protein GX366_05100 [Epulopiscium sp.]|nr:hypothetical protein [Candidatus Epulonipiscium sp.]